MRQGDRVRTVGLTEPRYDPRREPERNIPNEVSEAARILPEVEMKVELWSEPDSDIGIFGAMMKDGEFVRKTLADLPFSEAGYRGSLRMLLSASKRQTARLVKLLGEIEEK